MRINLLLLILLAVSQSVLAGAKIEHWQTQHGARVFYVHAPGLPMVDIQVAFDAGSARDGQQFGISSLTAALLDTGAGDWDADTIAQRFESVGAQFGAGSSSDMAWVSLRSLTKPELFKTALTTAQEILTNPSFNEQDFQRDKARTLAGLKHREESPGALAGIAFSKALYDAHPYAHPDAGFIETVADFTVQDLRQFYKTYYTVANAMVVIVGDLNRTQAEATANQLLQGLPTGQKPEEIPPVTMPMQGTRQHIEFPSKQTHVLTGLPGTHRKDKDYFTLYVGNHILGGSGLVSKLFKEVREKRGLAYSASSYFSPLYRKGPFIIGLQTRNDQTQEALDVVNTTLKDFIEKGPTEEELIAAKKNITGGFVLRFDTNNKLLNYVSMIGFYNLPLDYLDTFPDQVRAVTVESIKDAFKRRVDLQLMQTITVGAGK